MVAGVVAEHVENDRGGAHVGDSVVADGVVDVTRVEFAEADVDAADGRHSPGEGPAVAVEHR